MVPPHAEPREDAHLHQDYFSRPSPIPQPQGATLRPDEPNWHIPVYDNAPLNPLAATRHESAEEFPIRRYQTETGPTTEGQEEDGRRGSAESEKTLRNPPVQGDEADEYEKYSLTSYRHPYDIPRPETAHPGTAYGGPFTPAVPRHLRRVSFAEGLQHEPVSEPWAPDEVVDPKAERALKRRGIPSNMMALQAIDLAEAHADPEKMAGMGHPDANTSSDGYVYAYTGVRPGHYRAESSWMSGGSDVVDPDDPRVTGVSAKELEDPADIEKHTLKQMDYRTRRKHLMRTKIEFNVSCWSS